LSERVYPDEWHYYEALGEDHGVSGIRAFEQPDPSSFPDQRLRDEPLFKRLILSQRDMSHALSALTFIFQEVDFEARYSLEELRRFRCYETTFIVAYSRPFTESRGGLPRLSYKALGVRLTKFTRSIHESILAKRDKIFAHSDPSAVDYYASVMNFRRPDGSEFSVLGPTRFREGFELDETELRRANVLAECLLHTISSLLHEMHPNFSAGLPQHDFREDRSS